MHERKAFQYAVDAMRMLLPILYVCLSANVADIEVKPLSFDAKALKEAFNASADRPRLVGIFSPTCGHCLQACTELQQMLIRHPQARLKILLLWAPYMQRDNLALAKKATAYLTDERVEHFWDLWRFASRTYSKQLAVPQTQAWDMFVFYKPHLVWQSSLPEPTFWMQNRNLEVGTPYSQEALENEIKEWIQ